MEGSGKKSNNKRNKRKNKKPSQAAAATTENSDATPVASNANGEESLANTTTADESTNQSTVVEAPKVVEEAPQQQQLVESRVASPAVPAVNNNNFDNLQKAVEILGKAKALDEGKQFDPALKLYRKGVDMLLEELIERQGTDQSRTYLRGKCNDFMNRIDQIKMIIKIEKEIADKENSLAKAATTTASGN